MYIHIYIKVINTIKKKKKKKKKKKRYIFNYLHKVATIKNATKSSKHIEKMENFCLNIFQFFHNIVLN